VPKKIQITHGLKEGELVFVDDVPNGKHTYSVEVFDNGKTVLTRFILY